MFDLSKNDDILEILNEFGPKELEVSELIPLKHGWKNYVYLVNNNLVVRFPKSNRLNLVKEARLLDILSKNTKISVPKVNYVHFDPSFIAYDFIKGSVLERECFQFLNKNIIAEQLAQFFVSIHSLTYIDELQDLELLEYDYLKEIDDTILETNFLISNADRLISLLDSNNFEQVSKDRFVDFIRYWQCESVEYLASPAKESRLIHDDLHRKNILFDKNYKISGIIDFDEIKIGDIHLDFCNLVYSFDLDLVTKIMEKYSEMTGCGLDFKKTFSMGVVYILSNLYRNINDPTNPNFIESLDLVLSWIKSGY